MAGPKSTTQAMAGDVIFQRLTPSRTLAGCAKWHSDLQPLSRRHSRTPVPYVSIGVIVCRERGKAGAGFSTTWELLLAATLACLVMTIVAGYLTRLSLIEANAWVTHTDEVKLAIADGELARLRGNADAQRKAQENVGRLTIDNERQQQNLARARVLAGQGSQEELEELFTAMQREEDRLMVPRLNKIESARRRSSVAFVVGAALTLVFGAIASALLNARRHSLAAAHRAVAWQRALLRGNHRERR